MKLNSKIFDSIRVSGKRNSPKRADSVSPCQWKGCEKPGPHKAPAGRGKEGQYYNFCLDHVRHYNAGYNYFDGMNDAEVDEFRKDALTGHRPTWKSGANAWAHGVRDPERSADAAAHIRTSSRQSAPKRSSRSKTGPDYHRELKPLERKSLRALDLPDTASREDIKARFKALVKVHHPDANGGDSRSEEKLREIIQAYNYLKQAGMV